MKNCLRLLFSLLIIVSLYGCEHNYKIIKNADEWKELFDLKNYDSFSALSHIEIVDRGDNQQYLDANAYLNNDILYFPIQENGSDIITDYYYVRNYKELLLQEYMPHSSDSSIIMFQDYECASEEEIDYQFNELFANYFFYEWTFLPLEYNNAVYNTSNNCYDVSFSPDGYENITLDAEVYISNFKIIRITIDIIDSSENGSNYFEEIVFSKVDDFSIPNINTVISSEEEWRQMFTNNNFTSTHIENEQKVDGYMVNKDIILHTELSYDTSDETDEFYLRHEDDTKMTLVKAIPDKSLNDSTFSYDSKTVPLDGKIAKFDDYYINILSLDDYSDYYYDLKRVGNNYILLLDDATITFSIEDGKLIHMLKNTSDNEYVEILNYNYGVTEFENPLNK